MANISTGIIILFMLSTAFTVWQFYKASSKSKVFLSVVILWLAFQAVTGCSGFYRASALPPRFLFLVGPPLLGILLLFTSKKGRRFIDSLDLKALTLLHAVRIPVEICLFYLFLAQLVPVHMTFEGYNFDILSGLSAPLVYYLVFTRKKASRKILLAWNFICLALLLNILGIAVLSAQTPFQQLAFEQPNLGVTYFPFTWLPAVIVPLVLLSHLAAIRQLMKQK